MLARVCLHASVSGYVTVGVWSVKLCRCMIVCVSQCLPVIVAVLAELLWIIRYTLFTSYPIS